MSLPGSAEAPNDRDAREMNMSPRTPSRPKPRLLMCMTPGIGLARWQALGSLERELKPYVEYVRRGWHVTIATYDRPGTSPAVPDGINLVHCPHHWLRPLAPWFLRRAIRDADVVKTNQSRRSWSYVAAARMHRRPILLRCGWLPGAYLETRDGMSLTLQCARAFEGWGFRNATACMVATDADRNWIIDHYGVPPERIHLRPNFVDTELFQPGSGAAGAEPAPDARSVVMVGRLNQVKNPHVLIEAAAAARVRRLTLVGEGSERSSLEGLARRLGVDVQFPGSVPQADLPALLRRHAIFALPSKVEGHPKALFEAMACGLACIGANVPGIRDAIRDGDTGLVCEPRPASLAEALSRLMADPPLRERLGAKARRFVQDTLSFQTVMDAEIRHVAALLPDAGTDAPFPPSARRHPLLQST